MWTVENGQLASMALDAAAALTRFGAKPSQADVKVLMNFQSRLREIVPEDLKSLDDPRCLSTNLILVIAKCINRDVPETVAKLSREVTKLLRRIDNIIALSADESTISETRDLCLSISRRASASR